MITMTSQDRIYYWTARDRKPWLTPEALYSNDDVERIARYIEECGGTVGGQAERESLRRALEWLGQAMLRPRTGLLKSEALQRGKALRKAIKNAKLLHKTLGTKDAARYAAAVEADFERIEFRAFSNAVDLRASVRVLLQIYISDLCNEEKRLARKIRDYEILKLTEGRSGGNSKRETRFQEWLEGMASIWETSGLSVNTGEALSGFIRVCLPDRERCKRLSLEQPKPINKRTVIDWVEKVRHSRVSRERKL